MPREIGEFDCQLLRRHGVISVWGADDDDKSNLVDILYKGIVNGWLEEIEGVADDKSGHVDMLYKGIKNRSRTFERQSSWVDVPDPFNLKVFAQRLFLNFHSDDIRAKEITKVGEMGEAGLIEWCRELLSEEKDYDDPYVVVVYGVRSKGDWDLIQSTFFSSKATTAKGCTLVITNEETVATHCVKDRTHLAFNVKDLKANPSISALIEKGCWHYAIRGKKGRLFYDRRKDAREWANRFKDVGGINLDPDEGKDEEGFRVFMARGDGNNSEKCVIRHAYYGALFQQQIERRSSWVDVPDDDTFDLMDFSWHLFLDFYSDDPQAKETIAVRLLEGGTVIVDPIEKCREILCTQKCLVVLNGLKSTFVWDLIKCTFFFELHTQSIIIVGSAMSNWQEQYLYDTTNKALRRLGTGQEQQGRLIVMEYRRILSTQKRHQEVIQWIETRQPVGRDWEVGFLNSSLFKGRSLTLAVWGIPGVGKSTLIRTVYYNEILPSSGVESLYEAFAWVDVPCPFNLTKFSWHLLLDFYHDDPQAKETATISMMEEGRQVPILECYKILHAKKCLVVMDGLRSKQDWDLIKATFLAEPIKGTIIVITNKEEVAMHCAENNKERIINITRPEDNAAVSLLEKVAWEGKQLTCEEMEEAKSIVAKCGGLPKVIASIGEVFNKSNIWLLSGNFMGALETDPRFHGLRPLFSWMQSYFDACSDSIKPCIFYLSIFDAEKNIRLRRLLWRWIAEGYCRDTSGGRNSEDNGKKYISELVKLSIIQQPASNEVFCQINGFFHEYIISRPMEDNLVFALGERCSLNSTRAGQHLTIRSSWDRRDKIVYESIDFSRLRSLTVFGKWESFFICSKNVNMRLLRVLDLEDATDVTNEDLEKIGKLLPRLKFISLRGCKEITCLPSSMGCLRQLQTLDIRHTSIVTLPIFITELQKLRYIRAGTTEVWDWGGDIEEEDWASSSLAATPTGGTHSTGPVLPADTAGSSVSCKNRPRTLVSSFFLSKLCRRGGGGSAAAGVTVLADIGKLAVLHTLGVVRVNGNKTIFQELKKLTQLRKLGVSGINKGNIKELCSAVSGHAHLKSLSVELDKDYPANLDDITQLVEPAIWRKLKLDMTIEKLEEFPNPQHADKILFIHHLRIRPIQGGELHIGQCWSTARVVEIQCSSILHIKFDDPNNVVFWNIEVLKVPFSSPGGGGVSQSSLQISGLSGLTRLKEVWLKGYTDAHRQDMQRQINEMRLDEGQARPVLKLVQPRSSS